MRRREFFAAALVVVQGSGAGAQGEQSNFAPMDENGHRPVRLPPKPGTPPQLSVDERDALEHEIKCMCGCTLDVYTCRTTDFTCPVSPAMHRDVLSLVAGGYSSAEIVDAFVDVYGERVLTAPRARGFNWAGYLVPFAAMIAAATVVTMLLRRWTRAAAVTRASQLDGTAAAAASVARSSDGRDEFSPAAGVGATPDSTRDGMSGAPPDPTPEELERLFAAVRNDEDDEP